MPINLLILASLVFLVAAKAEDPIRFASAYGENMQLISGASATDDVKDGVFLSTDFVGTKNYVRVQKGYELDGFRPLIQSLGFSCTISCGSKNPHKTPTIWPHKKTVAGQGAL